MAHDPMHGFDFECLGSSVHIYMWRTEGNSKHHMHQKKTKKQSSLVKYKMYQRPLTLMGINYVLQLCEVWSEMYHHYKLCECLIS